MPVFRLSNQIADLESAVRLNQWMLRTRSLGAAQQQVVADRLTSLEIRLQLALVELELEKTGGEDGKGQTGPSHTNAAA